MRINFKHLFDWSVVSVSEPYMLRIHGKQLPIYAVNVEYLYHGKRRVIFPTDDFQECSSLGVANQYINLKKRQIAQTKTK